MQIRDMSTHSTGREQQFADQQKLVSSIKNHALIESLKKPIKIGETLTGRLKKKKRVKLFKVPDSIAVEKIQKHLSKTRQSIQTEAKLRIRTRRLEEYMKRANFSTKSVETIKLERKKLEERKKRKVENAVAEARFEAAKGKLGRKSNVN